ncbi:hypothetical protein ADL15_05185 [Actinoplanes awajinensis subsp. mycoplanecinus]|uniref:YncE family protein n=1 Tax=Actinoplanes awajinensis subsp. mycoplanecinus TaxID=135947 RepID=A0A0X3V8Z7_9ACTN|nr:hypothetical protein ADL15_05185 [Actinoplanes awajinensis subsp. mycoplanecinus]
MVLALAVSLPAGCRRAGPTDGCPPGEVAPVVSGPPPSTPGTPEALWVADRNGSLRAVDSRTDRLSATIALRPSVAMLMAAGGGRLFTYALDRGDVTVVDPVTARVVGHAGVHAARPFAQNRLVFAHRALWIAQPGRLWRISPAARVSSSPLPAGFTPAGLVGDGRWLWLTDGRGLLRVDPAAPAHTVAVPLAEGVAQLVPGLYASGVNSATVRRLDPDTGRQVQAVDLGEPVLSLVGSGADVWATGTCGTLTRLADRHGVRVSDVSQDLPSVEASGSLWVGDEVRSQVVRVDAATGAVLARTPFTAADPDDPAFVLVAGRSTIWVVDRHVSRADPATNVITRVLPDADPLAVAVAAPPR